MKGKIMSRFTQIDKTPTYVILAACLWDILSYLELNAGPTADGIVELHDGLKPALEFILRRHKRQMEIPWHDDSNEAQANSTDGPAPPEQSPTRPTTP